jgi:hypothetical protein
VPIVFFNPLVYRPVTWAAAAAGSHPTQLIAIAVSVAAAASAGIVTSTVVKRRSRRSEEGPQP